MTTNKYEINGTLSDHPLHELLFEANSAKLSGAFRVANDQKKTLIYLHSGEIVFAASNLRQHRLYEFLLLWKQITREKLLEIENYTNDVELAKYLVETGLFTEEIVKLMTHHQIVKMVEDALTFDQGDWNFNGLVRAKASNEVAVDFEKILRTYLEKLTREQISTRFEVLEEMFELNDDYKTTVNLTSEDGFVLSRFSRSPEKISDILDQSVFPNDQTLAILYKLWLLKIVKRSTWKSAFPPDKLQMISSAKLEIAQTKPAVVIPRGIAESNDSSESVELETQTPEEVAAEAAELREETKNVHKFLERLDSAETHYDVLGVSATADIRKIKDSYFFAAKHFHPDRFHQEMGSEFHTKLQDGFTRIAQAYENLKDSKARELYDFKIRRQIERQKERAENQAPNEVPVEKSRSEMLDLAQDTFEQGFSCLMDQEFEEAIKLLARASNIDPGNARYHAYYGKALSRAEKFRHQAEAELQKAIKLDATSVSYRIMLAEFYQDYNLVKRAEGELKRILAAFPNSKEAKTMLENIQSNANA